MRVLFVFFIISNIALLAENSLVEGEKLYTKKGCYGCHGINAEGANDFPKLSGKDENYLIKRLKAYRNEEINSNRADMMKPFAKKLSDAEIKAISKYLSSLGESKKEEYYEEEYDLSDAM